MMLAIVDNCYQSVKKSPFGTGAMIRLRVIPEIVAVAKGCRDDGNTSATPTPEPESARPVTVTISPSAAVRGRADNRPDPWPTLQGHGRRDARRGEVATPGWLRWTRRGWWTGP